MKRFIRIALSLVIATITLSSCLKESIVMYNYGAMGTIKAGVFTSDEGEILEIVDNETSFDSNKDTPRVFAIMDVLTRVEGTTNRFTAKLKSVEIPLTKDCLVRSEQDEPLRRDPISIHQAWLGGGYVNALLIYPLKKDSKVEHAIDLVVEGSGVTKDTLFVSLAHDAKGETLEKDKENVGFSLGSSYASFTLDELKANSYKYLCFEWDWYETDSYGNPYFGRDKHYKETIWLTNNSK